MYKILKINVIVITLITFSLNLAAQGGEILRFSDVSFPEIKLKERNFFITQVIDARHLDLPKRIGFVKKGVANRKQAALFTNNADITIANFLQSALPKMPNNDSIILKINHLKVGEKTNVTTETAFITADFDFIRKTSQGYFLIDNQSIYLSRWSLLDVTRLHIPNIITALDSVLNRFQTQKRWSLPIDSLIEIDTAALMYIRKAPILTDTVLKKGIYTSFSSFRNNAPTMPYHFETVIFDSSEKIDTILLITDAKGKQRHPKDKDHIWGFYNGEKVYIFHNGFYSPLTFQNGKAFFEGFDTQQRDENMFIAGFWFGILGSTIASTSGAKAASYELDLNNAEIRRIQKK